MYTKLSTPAARGLFDERDLGHARHDDHAHVGVRLLDSGGRHDAARIVIRAHVQQRQVCVVLFDRGKGVGRIGDGRDDVHVVLHVDGTRERVAQHGLIFGDDHVDHGVPWA